MARPNRRRWRFHGLAAGLLPLLWAWPAGADPPSTPAAAREGSASAAPAAPGEDSTDEGEPEGGEGEMEQDEPWMEAPPENEASPTEGLELEHGDTFEHSQWDEVLARHVTPDGRFDYTGLLADPQGLADLDAYLAAVARTDAGSLGDAQRMAFWINAYNACVVRTVLDHYPLASPRNLVDFYDAPYCRVAGTSISLNTIENERIGLAFQDPRYHFALCPGARGAPPLRAEAYTAEALDSQLADQAARYIHATTVVRPNLMEVELSRMFQWFSHDFERFGGVRTFVAAHLDPEAAALVRAPSSMLVYPELDWRLNEPDGDAAQNAVQTEDPL